MRVAFVLGFFDPVLRELQTQLSQELNSRSLLWIRQTKIGGPPNITEFRSSLFDRLTQGATHLLVVAAIIRGTEWIKPEIETTLAEAKRRFPNATFEIIFETKAAAAALVVQKAREFKCTIPDRVTRELLLGKLGVSKVLCVREKRSTSFRRALEREGITQDLYEEFFVEHAVESDSSSEGLRQKVRSVKHVFYAFDGFSHAFGGFLDDYKGTLFKASVAAHCATSFRKWLLEH